MRKITCTLVTLLAAVLLPILPANAEATELLPNGTFDADTGWTIYGENLSDSIQSDGGNRYLHVANGKMAYCTVPGLTNDARYVFEADVKGESDKIGLQLLPGGGSSLYPRFLTNGEDVWTHVRCNFTYSGSNGNLTVYLRNNANTDADHVWDNVSLKALEDNTETVYNGNMEKISGTMPDGFTTTGSAAFSDTEKYDGQYSLYLPASQTVKFPVCIPHTGNWKMTVKFKGTQASVKATDIGLSSQNIGQWNRNVWEEYTIAFTSGNVGVYTAEITNMASAELYLDSITIEPDTESIGGFYKFYEVQSGKEGFEKIRTIAEATAAGTSLLYKYRYVGAEDISGSKVLVGYYKTVSGADVLLGAEIVTASQTTSSVKEYKTALSALHIPGETSKMKAFVWDVASLKPFVSVGEIIG